jgi:DNA topoisomerase-1
MKIYYQINNLTEKKSNFFNSKKESIDENELPNTVKKVAMGFPQAVLFDPPLNDKIYAYVIDNHGRKQYFYTKEYKEIMKEEKYKNFPKIVPIIEKLLDESKKNFNKDEIYKSVLLMNECNFRIGHEKYKKMYNTNGALTINHKHIHPSNNKINIRFIGKKKEENFCQIRKPSKLYTELQNTYQKKKNLFNDIQYNDVYTFLKKYKITPKDIRQYSANNLFYKNIQENPIQENENPKKYMKNILEKTAEKMNHTPGVCKKEYLMPQWFTIEPKELHKITNKKKFKDFINILSKN